MIEPGDRLQQARASAGFQTATDAAHAHGWTPSTYLGHENGSRGISPAKAAEYAQAFKVSAEWLLFGTASDQKPPAAHTHALMVDVFDVRASAGNGSVVETEEVVERLSFPPDYLKRITKTSPRHLAIIGVKGDSMEPTLRDDDIVMLDRTKTSLDFDGLFVVRFGDALHVKRITRAARGHIRVISDNATIYPVIELPREEVDVVGKVIWTGKKV